MLYCFWFVCLFVCFCVRTWFFFFPLLFFFHLIFVIVCSAIIYYLPFLLTFFFPLFPHNSVFQLSFVVLFLPLPYFLAEHSPLLWKPKGLKISSNNTLVCCVCRYRRIFFFFVTNSDGCTKI